MKTELEIEASVKARLSERQGWGLKIEEFANDYGHVFSKDVTNMTEEKLWRLWSASVFAETGTPGLPKPTKEEQWQGLRRVTTLLADRSKSLGERLRAGSEECVKSFGQQNTQLPLILRALLILEGGKYGTIATRNHTNRLLDWAGKPEMNYKNSSSVTDALNNVAGIIESWAGRVGAKTLGERSRIPWHICEAIRTADPAETPVVDEPPSGANNSPTPVDRDQNPNLIYFGPPGTGKTYRALHELRHLLLKTNFGANEATQYQKALKNSDVAELRRLSGLLEGTDQLEDARYWWVVASPKQWDWETLFKKGSEDFRFGRLQRNYDEVCPGDIVFGYSASPRLQVEVIAKISEGLYEDKNENKRIDLEPVQKIDRPVTWAEIKKNPILKKSEPVQFRSQGTLFKLTAVEAAELESMLNEKGNHLQLVGKARRRFLQIVTFHQSYSYEDFVEGLRPKSDADGNVSYEVRDGVFKEMALWARQDPDHTYALIIDEINRGNISKIFGELITLLEPDKRMGGINEVRVILPCSGEEFVVPPNLLIVGTMNTADRSIALLDVALRRRFKFVEVLPQPELLGQIEGLPLDKLLSNLNEKLEAMVDRDHQLGHSYLMQATDTQSLYDAWHFKIIPLLQEYFYSDGEKLLAVLGDFFVEPKLINCGEESRRVFRLKQTLPNKDFIAALKELAS